MITWQLAREAVVADMIRANDMIAFYQPTTRPLGVINIFVMPSYHLSPIFLFLPSAKKNAPLAEIFFFNPLRTYL